MSPIMLLVLSALLAHATATPTPTRALLQAPDPVRAPPRCERPNNSLGVTCEGVGREWSGDEIDCRWDGDYELECEYDTELLSRDRVDCSLDVPGVGTDRSFDCPIVNSRVRRGGLTMFAG